MKRDYEEPIVEVVVIEDIIADDEIPGSGGIVI